MTLYRVEGRTLYKVRSGDPVQGHACGPCTGVNHKTRYRVLPTDTTGLNHQVEPIQGVFFPGSCTRWSYQRSWYPTALTMYKGSQNDLVQG